MQKMQFRVGGYKMIISSKCAVESLEIFKYLDSSLIKKIPDDLISYLNGIKDNNYNFEINHDISLYDNEFMDETTEIIKLIFNL